MSRSIRRGLAALGLATLPLLAAAPVLAQAGRKPPAAKPAPAAEPAPVQTPIFPCRTQEEVCYLAIVVHGQLAVVFTNATNAEGIGAKPVAATSPANAKLDMSSNEGRVVMLTGAYDPANGITKAEVVEVASPLASLALKAQLLSGQADEPAAPPAGARGAPPKRR